MNIATTCTDRKTMARGLAEHLGCSCEYLRTPTYAFQVGRLLVERDSSISGERDDLEAAAGWLLENGYIQEPFPPRVFLKRNSRNRKKRKQTRIRKPSATTVLRRTASAFHWQASLRTA